MFTVQFDPTQALDTQLFLPSDIAVIGVEIWAKSLETLAS